jgi:hypothetical protein
MDEINPYESPKHVSTEAAADTGRGNLEHSAARRAWQSQDFVFALAQQGICLGIAALIPDDGTMFRVCLTAVITHWVGTALLVVRRRTSPTVLDLGFLKFGFFFCLLVAFAFLAVWVRLRP